MDIKGDEHWGVRASYVNAKYDIDAAFSGNFGLSQAFPFMQGRRFRSQRYTTWHDTFDVNVTDAAGQLIGAIESLRDISDRKRSEDAIRLVNARFASVLRAATAYSIIATGPTGTIEVMNEGADLMLGYGAAELLGQATPLQFHDPKEVRARAREQGLEPGVEVLLDRARHGAIDTREWTYRRRDGSALTSPSP